MKYYFMSVLVLLVLSVGFISCSTDDPEPAPDNEQPILPETPGNSNGEESSGNNNPGNSGNPNHPGRPDPPVDPGNNNEGNHNDDNDPMGNRLYIRWARLRSQLRWKTMPPPQHLRLCCL